MNTNKPNTEEKMLSPEDYVIIGTTPIADLVEFYPEVVDFLIDEYDFFCVNCFMSEFESLEEGAGNHGIKGSDFAELLLKVNQIILK